MHVNYYKEDNEEDVQWQIKWQIHKLNDTDLYLCISMHLYVYTYAYTRVFTLTRIYKHAYTHKQKCIGVWMIHKIFHGRIKGMFNEH